MTEADVSAAKTAAAEFIRDGLFRLGPTFVKLGQARRTIALAHAPCTPALHPPCTPALHPPCTPALHPPSARRPAWRPARRLTRRAVRAPRCVQVVSTREDLLAKEYIDVLKDLQDNVPGFGGACRVERAA